MHGKMFLQKFTACLTLFLCVGSWTTLNAAVDPCKQARVDASAALFQYKCTSCHSMTVALSGNHNLPTDIRYLVTRMAGFLGSSISFDAQEEIINFMIFYAATQRKESVNQQLDCLSPDCRQYELQQIKCALDWYR